MHELTFLKDISLKTKCNFKSEADFKNFIMGCARLLGGIPFPIETEETVSGFPDVVVFFNRHYHLVELKYADEKGVVTFEKAQPLFYKRYPELHVKILVWDTPRKRIVKIAAPEVVMAKSLRLKIPDELLKTMYPYAVPEGM